MPAWPVIKLWFWLSYCLYCLTPSFVLSVVIHPRSNSPRALQQLFPSSLSTTLWAQSCVLLVYGCLFWIALYPYGFVFHCGTGARAYCHVAVFSAIRAWCKLILCFSMNSCASTIAYQLCVVWNRSDRVLSVTITLLHHWSMNFIVVLLQIMFVELLATLIRKTMPIFNRNHYYCFGCAVACPSCLVVSFDVSSLRCDVNICFHILMVIINLPYPVMLRCITEVDGAWGIASADSFAGVVRVVSSVLEVVARGNYFNHHMFIYVRGVVLELEICVYVSVTALWLVFIHICMNRWTLTVYSGRGGAWSMRLGAPRR